jgi:hypothetical protein
MKYVRASILFIFICVCHLIFMPNGCKDSSEFERPSDSLIEPPDAPILITPLSDTEYIILPNPGYVDVYFAWYDINDAEYYQLEYSVNENFSNSTVLTSTEATVVKRFAEPVDLYWHVRANSDYWTWYTPWSETRYFRIQPPVD